MVEFEAIVCIVSVKSLRYIEMFSPGERFSVHILASRETRQLIMKYKGVPRKFLLDTYWTSPEVSAGHIVNYVIFVI